MNKLYIFIVLLLLSCDGKAKKNESLKNQNDVFTALKNRNNNSVCHFKNDKLHGVCYSFYKNKNLKSKVSYHLDTIVDTAYFYYESGFLKKEEIYDKGKVILRKEYYPNGMFFKGEALVQPQGIIHSTIYFDSSGNIDNIKSNCLKMKLVGEYLSFKIISKNNYLDNKINAHFVRNFNFPYDKIKTVKDVKNQTIEIDSSIFSDSIIKVILECLYPDNKSNIPNHFIKEEYYIEFKYGDTINEYNLIGIKN